MTTQRLSRVEQEQIVQEASLAPSVHNTQPARWRFDGDIIEIYADPVRFLSVGDPELRDASLSCGAAVEGTVIALAGRELGVSKVEDLWGENTLEHGMRLAARIHLEDATQIDPLGEWIKQRFTWRGEFGPVSANTQDALIDWASNSETATLIVDREDIQWIADLNDKASLKFLSDKPYRDELVSWMRFNKNDDRWTADGLNSDAMQLSTFEALAAKIVLSSPAYEIAAALKLAAMMISEEKKTLSASGVVFFHVNTATEPLEIGRAFYRLWLHLTRLGVVAWPMAVIADDEHSNALCKARFGLHPGHRVVNVFRVGELPNAEKRQATTRLTPDNLIVR